ncbi:methylase involved in ubiquinone/menaquinone biosynthesis [Desulfitobacterium dichloroeliminans LMG P-21439]|uniref:Methylase involved in ubiquinone/menaquinone biosynthesis n=1 Tax=Desulfitobacterium dichloroeliminans (strain LMG P-21439 / DCA1) TaxID=871963 RepID=L0F4L7_DESDL|nr:class I SAM-dependent methyltransferase [Desulfitobacterium dichloroeliminans]AGA67888.1 methylase involved in ubiquinone/menaquinone biosynthesis [Desulfitobacterium dichloroeliminans LMG P-21439]
MDKKQMKLENPKRLEELNPQGTLKRIGFQRSHVLCDIGAGSGIFTLPAAKMTDEVVYAVEANSEMLKIIEGKAKDEKINNIKYVYVEDDHFDIKGKSVDFVLLVTVLHEIEGKSVFMKEIERLLNDQGKIAVIEFHKRETPMGPPIPHRISKEDVLSALADIDFEVQDEFELGENFYCLTFARKDK